MRTHRCPNCEPQVEHDPGDLCPSCGRCQVHCLSDNHDAMHLVLFETVGEGATAHKIPVAPTRKKEKSRA